MADEKKQGIIRIEALIKEGDLKQAYSVCNKLLLNFPGSGRIGKLQKKIEKTVYKQNLKSVKNDLKTLKPLWKEKNYKELVEKLEVLTQYVPGYGPVEKDLYKAKKLYREQLIKEQKGAVDDYVKNIEKLINEGKHHDAIVECRKLLAKIPGHEKVILLDKKVRDLYIIQQLKENKTLLDSKKFKEIELFLAELQKINPQSGKIKSLLDKASKRETVAIEYERKDFAFQSIEHIATLMQKHKWEKSVGALTELLKVDPRNIKAMTLLDKARKNFDKQLTKEVISKTKELQKKFKAQRANHPKDFVRL